MYADHYGFRGEMEEELIYFMREMDDAFIKDSNGREKLRKSSQRSRK